MTFSSGTFDDAIGAPVPNGGYFTVAGWYKNKNNASTGGVIDTGLENIYDIVFTSNTTLGPPYVDSNRDVDEPIPGGNVTVVTAAGDDGRWIAYGA